jgi:TfoX/Sxy family transcriptional regulator of competence genes
MREQSEAGSGFQAVVDAFAGDGEVSGGRMFASYGLKVRGKFFAFAKDGAMVVKLPRARVDELIAAGRGQIFTRGDRGVPMKEWIALSPGSDWIALAQEARRFVAGAA